MGDARKKSSTKFIKAKSRKGRVKNYIRENVRKLRKIQNERPKPKEERTDHTDHLTSYAERLKAVTSPHIKMIQKLSLLKEKKTKRVTEDKKKEHKSKVIKEQLNQISQTNIKSSSPSKVKLKKLVLMKQNEKPLKEEKVCSALTEINTCQVNNIETGTNKYLQTNPNVNKKSDKDVKRTDKKSEDARKDDIEHYDMIKKAEKGQGESDKNPSGKYFSESQIKNSPKGFKNEGCQARASSSYESVDSTAVVRFPRKINRMTKQLNKKMCEKSLQTEVNISKQTLPASKYDNRLPKKLPVANKKPVPLTEVKGTDLQINSPANNLLNTLNINIDKNYLPNVNADVANKNKINRNNRNNKKNWNPIDEKANRILNDLISGSNVDIRKLYNEITRIEKTSPFARHHTVFEKRSPEEIKQEHDLCMKNNPNRATGTVVLPDHKRREYLAQIKKRHSELLQQLNSIPVNTKSLEARQQKLQLGKALDSMDNAIKFFSKSHLLIDLNPSLTN